MTALDLTKQFLAVIAFVTIHEAAHVICAALFNIKTKKIIVTPIGEKAVMCDMEKASSFQKFLIFICGPAVNLILAAFSCLFAGEFFVFMKNVNLSLAFFNLLPVYPLDGGRIFSVFLNMRCGILYSNRILTKLSAAVSCIFIFVGIVQLVLFPYNISLLCIGVYLLKINKKEYLNMTFEFYRFIMNRNDISKKAVPVKFFSIDKGLELKKVLMTFCRDYYNIFYVYDMGKIKWKITEGDVIEYIQTKGINGTVLDAAKYTEINFY